MAHKKRDRHLQGKVRPPASVPSVAGGMLADALESARRLIRAGKAQAAIDLLQPLAERHSRRAEVHSLLGMAYYKLGQMHPAIAAWERTAELTRDVELHVLLGAAYGALQLYTLALREQRRLLKSGTESVDPAELRRNIAELEELIADTARKLRLPVQRAEEGLANWEQASLALHRNDWRECIRLNRKAISQLGEWSPAHNNLALALYYSGQPREALATLERVLARQPDNLHALCNAIHFLRWTGRADEARALWPRLEHLAPEDSEDRVKLARAAADLERDADVARLLTPLAGRRGGPPLAPDMQRCLAVAEANLGQPRAAQRRLNRLKDAFPWVDRLLAALKAGRPGPGLAPSYPYISVAELMPAPAYQQLLDLMDDEWDMDPRRFRQQMDDLIAHFPQALVIGEKYIWEEDQAADGIDLLDAVGTPAAYAALKRFGLGDAGEDSDRLVALQRVANAGHIEVGQPMRVWLGGEWREFTLHAVGEALDPRKSYGRQVVRLMDQAQDFLDDQDAEGAEPLLLRVLALDPRVVEAYNNLGAIYAHRGDNARAREMHHRSLEIRPDYPLAHVNLAMLAVEEGDPDAAEALLKPLASVARMAPIELSHLYYVQAKCLAARQRYNEAQSLLNLALDVWPDFEIAEELLARLEGAEYLYAQFASLFGPIRDRSAALRRRNQARITRLDPPLREVIEMFNKHVLTGIAHAVMMRGGWSTLRKAELIDAIIANLMHPHAMEFVTLALDDADLDALRDVLARGGAMPWQEFADRYDSDLDASDYWNYHDPETIMGRLRQRLLLAEATVDGTLRVCVPRELREPLRKELGVGR